MLPNNKIGAHAYTVWNIAIRILTPWRLLARGITCKLFYAALTLLSHD